MTRLGSLLRPAIAQGIAIVAVVACTSIAQAQSLTDALRTAYRNSNLLEQNRAVLRAADEDAATALAALRPTLNFVASSNWSDNGINNGVTTNSVALQLDYTLFNGYQRELGLEAARETVLATRQALIDVEQQVLLDAVSAYMDVLRATAFVSLRQSNVRLISEELRAARDRFEVGEVTRTDVAQAESRLASARALLATDQGGFAVAREAYRTAVGEYPGALSQPPSAPRTAANVNAAKDIARQRHPLILQAQRNVTVSELGIQQARGAYQPTIGARLRLGDDLDGNTTESASITFSQPIYQGGALAALERRSAAARDQARAALRQTVLGIEQRVGSAWSTVAVNVARLEAAERQIAAARVAFEGTREEARLGARTTLDVLDAEQELLDGQSAQIDAQVDYYIAVYSLLSAMGLLTVDHLQLGIQTYDPEAYFNAVERAPAKLSRQGKQLDELLQRLGRD